MAMHYELWTVPHGNMIDDFDSESEALEFVRELLAGTSPIAADSLLLTVVNDDGSGGTIATGAALAARVPGHAERKGGRPSRF